MAAPNADMAGAALALVARGFRVLPLDGKVPRCRRGVHDATTDPAAVTAWWRTSPTAGIGVACGDGLVVLDVDPRHGGEASLHQLEYEHGEILTLTARTGGGGLHLYLHGTLPARAGFLPGLDLKAAGGYCVAPPSLHASGRRYEWVAPEDLPQTPQPVPQWLADIVKPPRPLQVPRPAPAVVGTRYVSAAVEAECHAVVAAGDGHRNEQLNRSAFALARFVATGQADADAIVAALTLAARHAGLDAHEILPTIRSGMRGRRRAA
jgi:hypothetical protein